MLTLRTSKTVIIVEDDPHILRAIGLSVRQNGFEPLPLNSAAEVKRHQKFDDACCIILDVNLGDGSGIELRRWLAHSGVTLPIIFMTGQHDHATRKAAIQSGCVAFLTKPFAAKSLIDAIKRACAGPAQDAVSRDPPSPPVA